MNNQSILKRIIVLMTTLFVLLTHVNLQKIYADDTETKSVYVDALYQYPLSVPDNPENIKIKAGGDFYYLKGAGVRFLARYSETDSSVQYYIELTIPDYDGQSFIFNGKNYIYESGFVDESLSRSFKGSSPLEPVQGSMLIMLHEADEALSNNALSNYFFTKKLDPQPIIHFDESYRSDGTVSMYYVADSLYTTIINLIKDNKSFPVVINATDYSIENTLNRQFNSFFVKDGYEESNIYDIKGFTYDYDSVNRIENGYRYKYNISQSDDILDIISDNVSNFAVEKEINNDNQTYKLINNAKTNKLNINVSADKEVNDDFIIALNIYDDNGDEIKGLNLGEGWIYTQGSYEKVINLNNSNLESTSIDLPYGFKYIIKQKEKKDYTTIQNIYSETFINQRNVYIYNTKIDSDIYNIEWDDNNNELGLRPDSVEFNIIKENCTGKNNINISEFTDDVKLKYAVQLYDIEADEMIGGQRAGLTFGGAIGGDFRNSYNSHTPSGFTVSGNEHRCIHDDDWETIIHWNRIDPYVYEQCIAEQCTHTVLIDTDIYQSVDGDGYGAFGRYLFGGSANEGWAASSLRASLNGNSIETPYTFSVTPIIDKFPIELQNAIGQRKSLYWDKVRRLSDVQLKESYDKLFIPSQSEEYSNSSTANQDGLKRFKIFEIINDVSSEKHISYGTSYNFTWTRTPSYTTNKGWVLYKRNGNTPTGQYASDDSMGANPAFTLDRNYDISSNQISNLNKLSGCEINNYIHDSEKNSIQIPLNEDETVKDIKISVNDNYTTDYNPETKTFKITLKSDVVANKTKLKKYMVVNKDTEIPTTQFEFTIAAGQGNDPNTNSAVVYPGKEPSKVKINGTTGSGVVRFTAGESATNGPLNEVASADQKYAMKDIILDFSEVKFEEPGVYRYILTENSNSNNAINNDEEPVRVVDVHVVWNNDETQLIIGGYVGYLGDITEAPKLLPDGVDLNPQTLISSGFREGEVEVIEGVYKGVLSNSDATKWKEALNSISTGNYKVADGYKVIIGQNEYNSSDGNIYMNITDNGVSVLSGESLEAVMSGNEYWSIVVTDAIYNVSCNDLFTDQDEVKIIKLPSTVQDGSGKPSGSYVNADEPIGVEAGNKSDKYVNGLDSANLTLNKIVRGNQGSKDEYFEFTVNITNAGANTVISFDTSNAETSTHEDNITSYEVTAMNQANAKDDDRQKDGQQIITDENGEVSFKVYLHHGQSIVLKGLPKGTNYLINETAGNGYNISSENSSGEIAENVVVTFTNEKSGVVPTGILMTITGGVGLVIVAGIGLMLLRRKKNEEDDE